MTILILINDTLEKYYLENRTPKGIELILKSLEKYNLKYNLINYKKINFDEIKVPDLVISLIIPQPEDKTYFKIKKYFENKTKYINKYDSVKLVKNKYETIKYLNKNFKDIKTPKTFKKEEYTDGVLEFPLILKPNNGLKGENVKLIKNKKDLKNIPENYILQEAIVESFGVDIRLVIFNGELLYGIKRENTNDFRSNRHQGGKIKEYTPEEIVVKQAIKICESLDLKYVGVDFLISGNTYILCEINSFPGLTLAIKKAEDGDYSICDKACSNLIKLLNE